MSFWAEDPELFLHKGKDGVVHVLRCNKETMTSSSSSMLMKPEDFTVEEAVTDLRSLTGGSYDWDKDKYEALIDYIYPRHLLVNCHGSMIVELEPDEKNNKAADVVYIRALDILDMGIYGPGPDHSGIAVPVRTVKYLQDGTVVQTEPTAKEMKLSKEVETLQQELLQAKEQIEVELAKEIKLTEELTEKSKEVETLQQELLSANEKTKAELAKERELAEELTRKTNEVETLQQENQRLFRENTVRIYTKGNTHCSLTVRNGKAVLGYLDMSDHCQFWVKDYRYSAVARDRYGFHGYALVNKSTGQALKPTDASTVELVHYDPNFLNESILWTEEEQGDGYRAIRKLTNPALNLDASNPTSGIGDGTMAILWNWWGGDNQKWNIVSFW